MKKFFFYIPLVLVLLWASPVAGRADQFTQIANGPQGYWVPSPTPPVAYYYPPPGYYGPPPYYGPYYGPRYYGPPPPRVFLGFGFHIH